MRLFRVNGFEVWIGPDLETTKAAYCKEVGEDGFGIDAIDDACELTDKELDMIMIDISEAGDGSGPMITARQLLADAISNGGEFPRHAFSNYN